MSQEVAQFDPSKAMDAVKDRIKTEFAALLPDEQWRAMVQNVVHKFTQSTTQYGNIQPSEFEQLVLAELRLKSKAIITEVINSKDYQTTWDGAKAQVGEQINKFMLENSAQIFTNMMQGMFASHLNDFAYKLKNGQY